MPDYGMLCIGANNVDNQTTHQHFKLAKALDIPIFILLTKIDLLSEEQLQ
jgi:GTPase